MSDYAKYLKDKRVILVGPAPHMVDSNQRDFIESYDVIVRLNVALPVPTSRYKDIGNRTNVLYNCMHENKENGGELNIKYLNGVIDWISSPYPNHGFFKTQIRKFQNKNRSNKPSLKVHFIDTKYYLDIEKSIGCRPNTGFSAIMDLLNHDIKELYVCGITFFQGGYDPTYRPTIDGVKVKDSKHSEKLVNDRMNKTGNHKQQPQIDYLKDIYKNDNRLKGDEKFTQIMENNK